ncbi:MAG: hypothetical protein IJC76_06335 [Lachnospiraceae bacterium]|nr:hypothetical protein [Lachnospiraceae bacterium]
MAGKIKVLDCTLRDGGRCFENTCGDNNIEEMSKGLSLANIDFIEIGFLWYLSFGICRENSTVFRSIDEIKPFVDGTHQYAAYIEYVLFKNENHIIPVSDGTISAIRLGILKDEIDDSLSLMKEIKDKGYKLFVQGINTMSYSEDELIDFISKINEIKPYAFSIVDTFGSMYIEDLERIFALVDKHLDKNIYVAFHSHNNMQLSMALAMTLIKIREERNIIIDATLNGIGMGAGNLSTELICKYLNDKANGRYNLGPLVKIIDKNISKFYDKFDWSPSLLSYESAQRWGTQINLSYINNGYNISLEEKRKLLKMYPIGKGVPSRKIDSLYRIMSSKVDEDSCSLNNLLSKLEERNIVIVGKGPSAIEEKEAIQQYIDENNPIVIYINHINSMYDVKDNDQYYWYIEKERFYKHVEEFGSDNVITIEKFEEESGYTVNYNKLLFEDIVTDDSILLVLMMLIKLDKPLSIKIVGMDGTNGSELQVINNQQILDRISNNLSFDFLTKSVYTVNR